MSGRRTALPRQQTLRATIDWSYDLLPKAEKVVLRRLAVFRGGFTMEAAGSVVGDEHIRSFEVIEIIANLSQKSLVATDISGDMTYHYLLDTTRAYALEKLSESGEATAISRRHADYYGHLLTAVALNDMAANEFADCAREIDNIRAALTWAFSPGGDTSAAVRLAAASTPVWLELSLLAECLGWTRNALEVLDAPDNGTRWEMILQCAFGYSLMFTEGLSNTARAARTELMRRAECLERVEPPRSGAKAGRSGIGALPPFTGTSTKRKHYSFHPWRLWRRPIPMKVNLCPRNSVQHKPEARTTSEHSGFTVRCSNT